MVEDEKHPQLLLLATEYPLTNYRYYHPHRIVWSGLTTHKHDTHRSRFTPRKSQVLSFEVEEENSKLVTFPISIII